MATNMSYRIYTDGIFGGIRKSDSQPDDDQVFRTFAQARLALAKRFRSRAAEFMASVQDAARLTVSDAEPIDDSIEGTR
jgi:hypothetical protein